MTLRLGIDLDGVVADFNRGWTSAYNDAFGASLAPDMVESWDSPLSLTHFPDMAAFWDWAKDHGGHSVFRHLEPYPTAIETLQELDGAGHQLVILTAKPDWARTDTLRWLADHDVPTREIHLTEDKHAVPCDVYLDDAPGQVEQLARVRGEQATVCRFVRPWNDPVARALDVHDWTQFAEVVRSLGERAVPSPVGGR